MWGWQPRQSSLAKAVSGAVQQASWELAAPGFCSLARPARVREVNWLLRGVAASPKQPSQQWGEHATGELEAGCHLRLAAWKRERVEQCIQPTGELAALGYRSLAKAASVESQPARLGSKVRWGSTCRDKGPGQQDR